ncbi:MAG: hypothetical protein Kow0077_25800 [Anaerolineae bacterium]
MQQRLSDLLRLNRYRGNPVQMRQAIASYVVLTSALLAVSLGTFLDPEFSLLEPWAVFALLVLAAGVVLWGLLWSGRLVLARRGLLALSTLALAYPWVVGSMTVTGVLATVMFLIVVALLAPPRWALAAALLAIGRDVLFLLTLPADNMEMGVLLTSGSFYLLFGVLFFLLAEGQRVTAQYWQTQSTARRAQLATLSSQVAQRVLSRMELNELLNETVEAVRESFEEIYHAQVFLIDEDGREALLKASTGTAGQQLLARGHKLPVGSQSVIGQVTLHGTPLVALSGEEGSVHRPNELLPETRTELALPLISQDRVIGALDVQSTTAHAFTDDHINVLQTLANQIAVAIDHARLFEAQQQALEENQRLVQRAREQVAQIQDLNRRLTRQAWSDYLERREDVTGVTVDFTTQRTLPDAEWTPAMQAALESPEATLPSRDRPVVTVPLTIRGQAIGAMEFEVEKGQALDPEQLDLVQEVSNRLALALENTRLYNEAQQLARREAIINQLGARLQSVIGFQDVLVTAARGLQDVLAAPRVAIRLGTPPAGEQPEEERA